MKKLLCTVLALLTLTSAARADLIWEPQNSFYEKHRSECRHEDRLYYANGSEGFITFWDAPGGSMVAGQCENGEMLRVYFVYENWGCITFWKGVQEISGWAPMADLVLVYDSQSFQEEYAGQIRDYNGEFADYDGAPEQINFYAYPGAAGVDSSIPLSQWKELLPSLTGTADQESAISQVFTDENGLTWGYLGYLYGMRDVWFCLDEPDGGSFPLRDVHPPELVPARTPVLPAKGYIPYVLVGAVVLATAGLLFWFYGRKRARPSQHS